MSASMFAGAFAVGAALLAAWADARFDGRRPESIVRRTGHVVAASIVLWAAPFAAGYLVGAETAVQYRLAMLFLVVLPCLVYSFLAGLWLTRALVELRR